MHVSSRRTPGTRRRSLRGRAAMLGAALLLVTAQVLPAAVLATPNDGSIDASLRNATVAPGDAGVVDVAITCPDMGPAADGSEAIVAVVAAGSDGLSPVTPIDETGTWSDGVLAAAIRFTAPTAPGSYDLVVRVAGRACVDGSSATAAGTLTVEAPADQPVPTEAPTDEPVPTEAPSDDPAPTAPPAPTDAPSDAQADTQADAQTDVQADAQPHRDPPALGQPDGHTDGDRRHGRSDDRCLSRVAGRQRLEPAGGLAPGPGGLRHDDRRDRPDGRPAPGLQQPG